MTVTLAEANRMVQAAIVKAAQLNVKISVAVCDAGGRLLAFNRMDGATWAGAYACQGKAVSSATFGRTSGEVDASSPIVQSIKAAEGDHMIFSRGGVPIIRGGVVDGACGAGGSTGQQDEECARSGVESL